MTAVEDQRDLQAALRALPRVSLPIERFELSCGARLLVSRRSDAPVVAAQIHMQGGHSLDPQRMPGLSALTGGLLDQGSRRHGEEDIARLLEPLAGSIGGDASGLHGAIAGGSWRLLLELMAELATTPIYPEEKVERQKRRLLDRLLLEQQDPRARGAQLFRRFVYGEHWLGRPAHGTIAGVRAIRRSDLVAHHRRHWCAKRAIIAVCGDLEPKEVRRVLERALGNWRAGSALPPHERNFPPLARRLGVFRAERQQVHLYFGHLGVERKHPDFAPLVVLDHILGSGSGFTNRIARRLRDEQGLAYSVSANIHATAGLLPGTFTAYIGTSPENVEAALEGFLAEIDRIRREPVAPAELRLAQDYLIGSHALGFERASRRSSYLIAAERFGLPHDELDRLPERYAAVRIEDVQRVAQTWLQPRAASLAASGPLTAEELRDRLARAEARAFGTALDPSAGAQLVRGAEPREKATKPAPKAEAARKMQSQPQSKPSARKRATKLETRARSAQSAKAPQASKRAASAVRSPAPKSKRAARGTAAARARTARGARRK
jgi:zinc protease